MEKIKKTIQEIADYIQGKVIGNPDILITGISGIKEASQGDITFAANPKYNALLEKTNASCVIVSNEMTLSKTTLIQVENPSYAFVEVVKLFKNYQDTHPAGISEKASIAASAHMAKNVAIADYVVIEENVTIGENTIIYPGVYIGNSTSIGNNCLIYPNVVIREEIEIGNRVIIHSSSVIGSDGFGFIEIDGAHFKVPQLGTVVLEDDVEIGSCVAIDRARFGKTIISQGVKIDNLVQIAHNVEIGEHSLIVSQTGIAGSSKLGKRVTVAGQAGIGGHVQICDDVIITGRTGVTKSIQKEGVYAGYPARDYTEEMRIKALIRTLPEITKEFKELKKKVENLERKSDEKCRER